MNRRHKEKTVNLLIRMGEKTIRSIRRGDDSRAVQKKKGRQSPNFGKKKVGGLPGRAKHTLKCDACNKPEDRCLRVAQKKKKSQ